MSSTRRETVRFLVLACLPLVWVFQDALLRGWVLGQADLLFQFSPWAAAAPPDWRPGNWLLLDSPTQFVPFLAHARDTVLSGRFPLWTADLGAGQPFFAAFQTAVLSPFTALAYLVPLPHALTLMAAAKLLVGAFGMWTFLRACGLRSEAAAFGGLAYLLNSFSIAWLEHPHAAVAAWAPWALWASTAAVRHAHGRSVALLAAVTAVTILSGHPETAFKVYLLCGTIALWQATQSQRPVRGLAAAALGVALGTALCAVQILPFFEYLEHSRILATRADATGPLFTNPWGALMTMIVPDFYGTSMSQRYLLADTNYIEQQAYVGLATWLLAACALTARRHRGLAWLAIGSTVASALIMFGTPLATFATTLLPPLQVAALSRFGLLVIMGLVIAAAIGLDDLLDRASSSTWSGAPVMAVAVAVLLLLATTIAFHREYREALLAGGQLAATQASVWRAGLWLCGALVGLAALRWYSPTWGARGLQAVVVCDLLAFGTGVHPLSPPAHSYPPVTALAEAAADPEPVRVAGWQDALYPNAALVYGLQDYRSYDAMGVRDYGELLDVGFKFNGAFHSLVHFATPHLLDLLTVKYVVTPPGVEAPADHFTRLHDGPVWVYRNDRVMPRAFLVDHAVTLTGNAARRAIRDQTVDLRRTVVLDTDLPSTHPLDPAEADLGRARITTYTDDHVEVETSADGHRLLVLTDTWFPGWQVEVDGAPAELRRANFAFRGVWLPPGRHVVSFTYAPASVRQGAWISLAALVLVLTAAFQRSRERSTRA